MFSLEQKQMIQRINNIIDAVKGYKNRYRIYILPNPFKLTINVKISDLTNNECVYENTIQAQDHNYLELINTLRNNFILHSAVVSKLTTFNEKKWITYCEQEIYLYNLEMGIKINNKREELEAAKAHSIIIKQDFENLYDNKTKTIQPLKVVG